MANLILVPVLEKKDGRQKKASSLTLESVICHLDTEKFGGIYLKGDVSDYLNLTLMRKLQNCNALNILVQTNSVGEGYVFITDWCNFGNLKSMVENFAEKQNFECDFFMKDLMTELEKLKEGCLQAA